MFVITETEGRFGRLRLVPGPANERDGQKEEWLYLVSTSPAVYREIAANPAAMKFLSESSYSMDGAEAARARLNDDERKYCFLLNLTDRGIVKEKLLQLGWPVKDDVPLKDGARLDIRLRETSLAGQAFSVRDYQTAAAEALVGDRGNGTGFGTIVLPCGAGKTIVGIKIMSLLQTNTLILTTNISAVHQWINELLDKTSLTREQIAEYTGEQKTIQSVTVATYQILTWRPNKDSPYPHFSLFRENNWGLVIYDEVHMLPAPVFRVTAELQAVRRVGLTATLVREDGCEGQVFSLVGPKRYDVPWKELEKNRWIASALCIEIRLDMPESCEIEYAVANARLKHRLASENPVKAQIVAQLVRKYAGDKILIIGQYLDQLKEIAAMLEVPIITGKTPNAERDQIYDDFRQGKTKLLVVSKVANFAIDLPDASMAIQVSGSFGSRQEEAQRLGRVLRPKSDGGAAHFYSIVTQDSKEQEFAMNRQLFLTEQGYAYKIIKRGDWDILARTPEELAARK